MYLVDARWIVLTVCVGGVVVATMLMPSLLAPVGAGVAVATLLYVLLRLGR